MRMLSAIICCIIGHSYPEAPVGYGYDSFVNDRGLVARIRLDPNWGECQRCGGEL